MRALAEARGLVANYFQLEDPRTVVPVGVEPLLPTAGDWNGDGWLDLAIAVNVSAVHLSAGTLIVAAAGLALSNAASLVGVSGLRSCRGIASRTMLQ